ncbi:MAG: M20/M25/M40 family metallo-hydrolase, partial [Chitinophagaceae bacterium]
LPNLQSYKQQFEMIKASFVSASGSVQGRAVSADSIIGIATQELLEVNEASGFTSFLLDTSMNMQQEAARIIATNKKAIVFVHSGHAKNFTRLKRFKRDSFEPKEPVLFVLADAIPATYNFEVKHTISKAALANVIGVIPGKKLKEEMVIFSAHYDHLGIGKPNAAGDSIYNGANDDAAGTTAVMMLADYFAKQKDNERTLVFVAFTAEEIGGFGSRYFSNKINPDKAVAMVNIEMIGTQSEWGKNSAYITGYEKSDFGKILQGNLAGTPFKFEPDPYPKQNLFYRSDNATLAALGVPAHTISTAQMNGDKTYHTQDDEIETLDVENMAAIIRAIAISSKGIVSGKETPSRVEKLAR